MLLQNIGSKNGNFAGTAGTIACGSALAASVNVHLVTNSGYAVAMKQTPSTTGTVSNSSASGIVRDGHGPVQFLRPTGTGNWYLAYRVYNAGTASKAAATDLYFVDLSG